MSLRILHSQIFYKNNELFRQGINASASILRYTLSRQKSQSWSTHEKVSTAGTLKATYPFPAGTIVDTRKVTVVGSGPAAISSTLALLATGTTSDVCMLGLDSICKLRGEEMDIKQASVFLNNPKIFATQANCFGEQQIFGGLYQTVGDVRLAVDPAASRGSEICVIATGTEQGEDEDSYEYTARNIGTIRAVIPHLMKYSPTAVYLIASDPVDVLTREAYIAGGMHQSRIFGTGTNLYSAMFRSLISSRVEVHAATCHGLVLGQYNPCKNPCVSSGGVPVWSGATIQGVRLMDLCPEIGTETDSAKWQEHYDRMIKDEQLVRKLKGGYNWAAALSIVDICQTILNNMQDIRPVSTFAQGKHNIVEDVFLSLPCVLGSKGIVSVLKQPLSAKEAFLLRKDASRISKMQSQMDINISQN